ncbi:penicillin acylase family protein [Microbacterium sp. No. 7]|uniref:penicillin acylase family protein n=1 Tax=Microbacterium sp. No. 7 TaxID=1714373 RepID=UPI000A90BAA9|nr:penicillin acylase family protein [Microbacterium sp. No. 7]
MSDRVPERPDAPDGRAEAFFDEAAPPTRRSRALMRDDLVEPQPAKRSLGRKIGIGVFTAVAALTVIALIAAGLVVFTIQRSFPQLEGTVALDGLAGEVTVQRDDLGIPTIVADTDHDLFFAQGYVHAQDRFWEMDFRRHLTSGRLAELFGESQLKTDAFLRTLGWRDIAEQEVAAFDDDVRANYEAYADGVNAYLADHDGAALSFEYAVLGLQNSGYEVEPWTPADSVAWLKAMAWDLRANVETEAERALLAQTYTAEELLTLYPGYPFDRNPVIVSEITTGLPAVGAETDAGTTATPAGIPSSAIDWREVSDVVAAASDLIGGAGEGIGSNSWVVSGRLTESGLPLLANDPHLGASLPSVWHQSQLRCREKTSACTYSAAGFGFSGVPGVIIGHNDDIAWGFTNLSTDVSDLYIERVQGDQYWRDGALVPLEVRTETLRVAGGDPVEIEVRSTVHGPIVSGLTDTFTAIADDPYVGDARVAVTPDEVAGGPPADGEFAVSLAWTALEPGTTASAIFAMGTAQDFDDFRAAAAQFDVPAQNLVYADLEGNIGYQTPGKLPVRHSGDGSMPVPGWTSQFDWQGFVPFEELPVVYNPPSGYIVTANNAIIGPDYPHHLTNDWDYGWRAARIADLIERTSAVRKLTADDMSAFQADEEFWIGKRLAAEYSGIAVDDPKVQEALDLLDMWDAQNSASSAEAAFANVLWDELAQNLFARRDDPVPLSNQARLFLVVDRLFDDPTSPWWTNDEIDVSGKDAMLRDAAERAYARLSALQGDTPHRWNWGRLHAIGLTHGTFGSSGIAPIEMLFNRGPYPVGGGASVVNATGWALGSGSFATTTVPSMRMTVDLSDFDASRWNHLTGTSGHVFHPNYVDQVEAWQQYRQTPWRYSLEALEDAATHTLVLTPAG